MRAMLRIFAHFGFTAEQSQAALEVARSEDIRRMDDTAMAERPQIQSRTISKWREILSAAQIAHFEERYGDLIKGLGYEPVGAAMGRLNKVRAKDVPPMASTSQDPEFNCRPMAIQSGQRSEAMKSTASSCPPV